ncbi:TPA: transposase [Burkholderia multivorans]|nr:integrase core domain-containing protein [Burkholderia multivorans]MBJ9683640.1 transposase [Burkholderia multivorans]MBU9332090.1 transposase [Burkholderia multivorans]RSB74258.1 hypothetical protein EGT33_24750 [Burkholderia multivorans]HEM7809108.1 transposase [Burkholderia multivorans]HEM7815697.1 transposase [Burkholderia multivorans]
MNSVQPHIALPSTASYDRSVATFQHWRALLAIGKPSDKGLIETFNGSLEDECLSLHWFASVSDGKRANTAFAYGRRLMKDRGPTLGTVQERQAVQ